MKENRGNEGTCVGVSRWPVHDFNHRTTSDMWLYRAYSGNLYHNGEQTLTLSSFTQGDFITCVLDMEARTISFGKNGEVRREPGSVHVGGPPKYGHAGGDTRRNCVSPPGSVCH